MSGYESGTRKTPNPTPREAEARQAALGIDPLSMADTALLVPFHLLDALQTTLASLGKLSPFGTFRVLQVCPTEIPQLNAVVQACLDASESLICFVIVCSIPGMGPANAVRLRCCRRGPTDSIAPRSTPRSLQLPSTTCSARSKCHAAPAPVVPVPSIGLDALCLVAALGDIVWWLSQRQDSFRVPGRPIRPFADGCAQPRLR